MTPFFKMPVSRKAKILIVLSVVYCLIVAAVVLPILIRARNTAATNACINHLRQIDGAKHTWAFENKKTTNDVPTVQDIRPYLGRGPKGEMLYCPQGGIYKIGRIADPPSCTIHGSSE